jgi:hypothetical protein
MIVIRLNGKVINLGAWDTKPKADGAETNPLPAGAEVSEEEVVENADGGLCVKLDSLISRIDAETKSRIIGLFEGATSSNYLEKQMNAMMRAVRLNAMPKSSQTAAQKEEAAALTEIAARVESLRAIGKAAKTDGSNPSDINWTRVQ